jgi:signal transduction histidine kinase/CheY-like chemotaxis protein/HPt (histidine-containing phosphotransfer) domain-containing protein
MVEDRQQQKQGGRAIRFGIRAKLIIIFVLIKVIPLVALAMFAARQIGDLGGTVQRKYEEMVGDTRRLVGQIGGLASERSITALDRKSRENIERLTTDTARSVAAFLYERDSDILLAAKLPLTANAFATFLAGRTGKVILHRPWMLNEKGDTWVGPEKGMDKNPEVSSLNVDNKKDFHYRRAEEQGEAVFTPLYHEMTFVDLAGQEEIKVSATRLLSRSLNDVSKKENTWCRAEDYFPALQQLKEGEIYVSKVIGPYVSSPIVGSYTKESAAAKKIPFAPEDAAYAGKENPVGRRFQGIIRWATPIFQNGKKIGYLTLALDHTHVMEFTDHLVPTEERYSPISDAGSGNYAFMWDNESRNISHPRDYFITGYDPKTGDPAVPWLSEEIYDMWRQSGRSFREFEETAPRFLAQSLQKKASKDLTAAGMLGLDCRFLNFAPQCVGWHNLTQYGGSGSFVIFWSKLWKLNTAAAIPYFTGMYGKSLRGFGYVTIGANVDEFHSAATETAGKINSLTGDYVKLLDRKHEATHRLMGDLVAETTRNLTLSTLIMILVVLCIAVWMASTLTGRIKEMIAGIRRFQKGALDNRLVVSSEDEMGELTRALNDMADTVDLGMREIREARDKAEESGRAKSVFLANMSHEIRTPMNAIIGMSRLALEASENEMQRRLLESVSTSADSLLSVVNDILDFSKIEAGQLTLDLEPFPLRELIESTVASMRVLARGKNLEMPVDIAAGVPLQVKGDGMRLRQILFNLLGNAIKFTDKGEVSLSVASRGEKENRIEILFIISDTGIGIEKDHREIIFNSFTQADNTASRKYQGTGLGLSICRKLCQLMGGDISVESEPGVGSTFSFFISFQDIDFNEKNHVQPERLIEQPSSRPLKILLVEDNETNRDLGRMVLENMGHQVLIAVDGVEALRSLAQQDVDIVLMDVQMPVMDGLTTTQIIRAVEQGTPLPIDLPPELWQQIQEKLGGGHLKIIALTAHAMSGDRERCLAVGMDDYLTKPFIPEQVADALVRAMANDMRGGEDRYRDTQETRIGVQGEGSMRQEVATHLRQYYGLSEDKSDTLIATTIATIHKDLAKGERALVEGDVKEVENAAHSLKGSLLNLGLDDLAGEAESIEHGSREQGIKSLGKCFEKLRCGLRDLIDQ